MFHLTKLRLSKISHPYPDVLLKSNPIFMALLLTKVRTFFWTIQPWKSYLCNTRQIVLFHIVFHVVFSTIPRNFGALSLRFFRILLSNYLSSLALSIFLFGFLALFFMYPVYLKLNNNILYSWMCFIDKLSYFSAKFTIVCFRSSLNSFLLPNFLGTEEKKSILICMSMHWHCNHP